MDYLLFLIPQPAVPFMLVSAFCVLLVGIDKSGFGAGFGMLALPLMTLVVPPAASAAILLPVLCGCDLFALYAFRRDYDRPNLRLLVPSALAGIVIGALVLAMLRRVGDQALVDRIFRAIIGAIAVIFAIYQFVRGWLLAHLPPTRGRRWLGWLLGGVAGLTSTVAHAGGPPVSMFLFPQGLDRRVFVGTTVWFFAIVNYVKLIPYGLLGMLKADHLLASAMLIPFAPMGIWLGVVINRRISQRWFERLVLVILLLTGLQLLSGYTIADLLGIRG